MMAGTAVLQTLATLCLLLLAAKMGSELARKVKLVPSIGELLAGALVLVATTGKILGCGLPVLLLTNDWRAALAIGSGMMARGGVSPVIASAGIAPGVLAAGVFTAVVLVVIATITITPVITSFCSRRLNPISDPVH